MAEHRKQYNAHTICRLRCHLKSTMKFSSLWRFSLRQLDVYTMLERSVSDHSPLRWVLWKVWGCRTVFFLLLYKRFYLRFWCKFWSPESSILHWVNSSNIIGRNTQSYLLASSRRMDAFDNDSLVSWVLWLILLPFVAEIWFRSVWTIDIALVFLLLIRFSQHRLFYLGQ